MRLPELTSGQQYWGMRSKELHVVALAARATLNTVLLDPNSLRRQFAGCGFLGRSALAVMRDNLLDPQPAVVQSVLAREFVGSIGVFVGQPQSVRDKKLTTYVRLNDTQVLPQYRSRVIAEEEVRTYGNYRDLLEAYTRALESKDEELVRKYARQLAEVANPEAWGLEKGPADLVATADDTAAYLDIRIQQAADTYGPPESWNLPAANKQLPYPEFSVL